MNTIKSVHHRTKNEYKIRSISSRSIRWEPGNPKKGPTFSVISEDTHKKGLPLKILIHLNSTEKYQFQITNPISLEQQSNRLTWRQKQNPTSKDAEQKPRITVRNGNTRLDPRNNIRKFEYLQFNRIAVIKITRIATDLHPGREIGAESWSRRGQAPPESASIDLLRGRWDFYLED